MHARSNIAATLAMTAALAVCPRAAPADAAAAVERFRCGHALLAEALAAHGGEALIAQLGQIEFVLSGDSSNAYQGYSAARVDDPEHDGSFTLKGAFDLAVARYWQSSEQRLRGGLDLSFDTIATGNTVINVRNAPGTFTVATLPTAEAAVAQAYDFPARFLPPLLLRRARENIASVRCEPGSKGPEPLLAFNWDPRTRFQLALDPDRTIVELRTLQPDVLDGEAETAFRYGGRQQVGGLVLPRRVTVLRRSSVLFDLQLADVQLNRAIVPERFAAPKNSVELKDPAGIWSEKIADGVWEVRGLGGGLYRTPVVEAADFLVVFDTPLAPAVTRQVLAHIKEKISAKPVRYVVLSHFHTDHSAGLPAYHDAGATVLVTPTDEAFVRRALGGRSRLFPPVSGSAAAAEPAIRVIDSNYHIEVGPAARLEIVRLRNSPHVADILLAVHRPSGTVLEGDLFSTLTPFNETYACFADWLKRNARDVKLVAGIHHDPTDAARIIESARTYRAAEPQRAAACP